MDIISKKITSGRFYAYHAGRFWFWDEARNLWKESHLLTKKYNIHHETDQWFTPEDFMTDPSQFEALEDYQVDYLMKNALKDALPCQNAPIEPVKEQETAVSAPVAQNTPFAPAFDFSALGDLSGQAAEADQQFDLHYGAAQDEYLISCIYLAKVHALTAKAGRYGGGTWTKWYESKGLGEGSVRRMIQNGEAFKSANMAELKQLPELTRKDLNLIARSGCAEQLTKAAGNGQKVQALIDRLRADVQAATERANAATADVQGLAEANSRLNAEKEQALQRAAKAEEALKHQPIAGVVDEEEVDRRAHQQAYSIASDMTEENRRELEKVRAELAEARAVVPADRTADKEIADSCCLNIDGIWGMALPSFQRLIGTGEDFNHAADTLLRLCDHIHEELVKMTITNDKEARYE